MGVVLAAEDAVSTSAGKHCALQRQNPSTSAFHIATTKCRSMRHIKSNPMLGSCMSDAAYVLRGLSFFQVSNKVPPHR